MKKKLNDNTVIFVIALLLIVVIVVLLNYADLGLTGQASTVQNGTLDVTVTADIDLSTIDASSNLGSLRVGTLNNTDNLTTQRMEFGNNGSSKIQVTVQAGSDIWARSCPNGSGVTTGADNNCFNISCEDGLLEKVGGSTAACVGRFQASTVNFNQTPITSSANFVTDLQGKVSYGLLTPADNFTVGWSLYAPNAETSGAKSVQIVFTASEDTS